MPIAIAPVERQRDVRRGEFGAQHREQRAHLIVNRTATIEMIVVLGDRHHSFAGDILAAQDVLEKRQDVIVALRAAEGHNENRVVRHSVDRSFRIYCAHSFT